MDALPKPLRVSRSKLKEHRRYSLTDAEVRALIEEGLRQQLYLGRQPGTSNRMKLEVTAVWLDSGNTLELGATVDTWNE